MELSENDQKAYSFAELVRKMSHRIATLSAAGKSEQAAELALTLCEQAETRKREVKASEDDHNSNRGDARA